VYVYVHVYVCCICVCACVCACVCVYVRFTCCPLAGVVLATRHWSAQSQMKPPTRDGWDSKSRQYSSRLPVLRAQPEPSRRLAWACCSPSPSPSCVSRTSLYAPSRPESSVSAAVPVAHAVGVLAEHDGPLLLAQVHSVCQRLPGHQGHGPVTPPYPASAQTAGTPQHSWQALRSAATGRCSGCLGRLP
jgi:hypothetical protein